MKFDNQQAHRHLKRDAILSILIELNGEIKVSNQKDLYLSLLTSIVSQQLSTKAADTIYNRFIKLFPEEYPEPNILIRLDNQLLRNCGLSFAKASYLKNVAVFSLKNDITKKALTKLNDDQVIALLSSIKGIGKWSAEMILMFTLNRPDVLPLDDLGIQSSMKSLYGLSENKKEMYDQMIEIAESWRPYRTLACKHLWRIRD